PDAFPGPGRREAEHVLQPLMPEIVAPKAAKHDPVWTDETAGADFRFCCPTRRAVGGNRLRLTRTPDRHTDRDPDPCKPTGCCGSGPRDEYGRGIGIVVVPPPEEGERHIHRRTRDLDPGRTKLRLEAKPPRRPLRREPYRREHDRKDDEDLAPEDLGRSQV